MRSILPRRGLAVKRPFTIGRSTDAQIVSADLKIRAPAGTPFKSPHNCPVFMASSSGNLYGSELLGFLAMFHSDHHISLFVPLLDVPEGLGGLFQGIASIDNRSELSRLNQLL